MPAAVAALVAGLACAGAGARDTGGGEGAGEKGARAMRVVSRRGVVEVAVGEAIDLVVTRPVGIPEQLQCEWPAAPRIEGGAVRFVRRRVESPPPEADGGAATFHYELAAEGPGSSQVTLAPKPAGPEASCRAVTVEVIVRAGTAP